MESAYDELDMDEDIEHELIDLNSDIKLPSADDNMMNAPSEDQNDDMDTAIKPDSRTVRAIRSIEDLVLSFLTQLADSCASRTRDEPVGKVGPSERKAPRRRRAARINIQIANRRKPMADGSTRLRTMTFPRNGSAVSAKAFGQLFRVLELMHEALTDDMPATKRDIYYKDVPLFQSQGVVDRLVDDLAATFDLERSDLNVRATSKGLVCGSSLVIHLHSGEVLTLNDTEGSLIPVGEDILTFSLIESISWVLIVEKDAVFQTLCRLKLTNHPELPGRGLIVTGKGYPDVATRQLVKSLSDNLPPSIPILALVDGDPYGLDILSVYRNGSEGLKHENSKLAADRVRWLGLWASELSELGIDKDALIPITKQDEKKALAMLSRPGNSMPRKWRRELMHLLHIRRKAEIEVLSTINTSVIDYAAIIVPSLQPVSSDCGRNMSSPPLLRYLVRKISHFVTAYKDRST